MPLTVRNLMMSGGKYYRCAWMNDIHRSHAPHGNALVDGLRHSALDAGHLGDALGAQSNARCKTCGSEFAHDSDITHSRTMLNMPTPS